MSVAQLGEHLLAHAEELLISHPVGNHRRVTRVDLVPVHSLLLEEAVMLVENGPKLLESASGVGIKLLYVVAGRQRRSQNRKEENLMYAEFHLE